MNPTTDKVEIHAYLKANEKNNLTIMFFFLEPLLFQNIFLSLSQYTEKGLVHVPNGV